jgi:hypothetical protein
MPVISSTSSVTAEEVAVHAPQSRTHAPKKKWILFAKVATAVISAMSVITGVIAVIPILTRDASNFSSLTIDVLPYPSGATEWALPLSTDFASYPANTDAVCGPEQEKWLERNGEQITSRLLIDFRNAATDGPMLTVKDFRVVGIRTVGADPAILVGCSKTPPSGVALQAARIDASNEVNVAVYSADAFGQGGQGIPDIPVVWNLAPGEGGQLLINVASTVRFDGELNATILSGRESRSQQLGQETIGALSAPPLIGLGTVFLQAAETLECRELIESAFVDCDLAEVLTRDWTR